MKNEFIVCLGVIRGRAFDRQFRVEGQGEVRLVRHELRKLVRGAGESKTLAAAEHDVPISLPGQAQRDRVARLREVLRGCDRPDRSWGHEYRVQRQTPHLERRQGQRRRQTGQSH